MDLIITEMAVFEVVDGERLKLTEIAPDIDISEIVSSTGCEFSVADDRSQRNGTGGRRQVRITILIDYPDVIFER